jgi:uncharacterized repeat protein (TIGR03803 family)
LGCGVVFKIAPNGSETVLYAFTGAKGNGNDPEAALIADKGYLFGTTFFGGRHCGHAGCGTVFKVRE